MFELYCIWKSSCQADTHIILWVLIIICYHRQVIKWRCCSFNNSREVSNPCSTRTSFASSSGVYGIRNRKCIALSVIKRKRSSKSKFQFLVSGIVKYLWIYFTRVYFQIWCFSTPIFIRRCCYCFTDCRRITTIWYPLYEWVQQNL